MAVEQIHDVSETTLADRFKPPNSPVKPASGTPSPKNNQVSSRGTRKRSWTKMRRQRDGRDVQVWMTSEEAQIMQGRASQEASL